MIPILSSLSVSYRPEICLRFRCSSRYLRIPPLHLEFQSPLRYSSQTVFNAVPELSSGISRQTYPTTCGPFTPNKSEQRSPPTYYRGCWHVVSRGFLQRYRQISSLLTAVYNPKTFIPHAALLGQTFVHCPKFSTAASRRSLGSISVPMWLIVLSDQLPIIALVGRYLTNQLMGREPIRKRIAALINKPCSSSITSGINSRFQELFQTCG